VEDRDRDPRPSTDRALSAQSVEDPITARGLSTDRSGRGWSPRASCTRSGP